jgi:predicted dithiol-disulfide oxidoreductase (DUF899 family)
MIERETATREQWLAAREDLLKREKEHTRLGDELARQRRELAWVRIEKDSASKPTRNEDPCRGLDGRSQRSIGRLRDATRATRRSSGSDDTMKY